MQEKLTEGYRRFVEATSTSDRPTYMAPVGLVFKTIHDDIANTGKDPTEDNTLFSKLYDGDGSHPSPFGTYLSALTLFSSMTGKDPASITYLIKGVDGNTAKEIQDAVSRTILETFESQEILYPWTTSWTGVTLSGNPPPAESSNSEQTSDSEQATDEPMSDSEQGTDAPTDAPTDQATDEGTDEGTGEDGIIDETSAMLPNPDDNPDDNPDANDNPDEANPDDNSDEANQDGNANEGNPDEEENPDGEPQDVYNDNPDEESFPDGEGGYIVVPPGSIPPRNRPGEIFDIVTFSEDQLLQFESNVTDPSALNGSITVFISYDQYPEDIAWTLVPEAGGEPLHFQAYGTVREPFFNQTTTFENLNPKTVYLFKISDKEGDGICCSHGDGYVEIMDNSVGATAVSRQGDNSTSNVIFKVKDSFGAYFSVDVGVNTSGDALLVSLDDNYQPSTWPELETTLMAPSGNETQWPGKFPTTEKGSLVINVDLDDNPEEISWTLETEFNKDNVLSEQQDSAEPWVLVDTWDGTNSAAGTLNSTEFSQLTHGWYRLFIEDIMGNGLCCENANEFNNNTGYVTVTGPLKATRDLGLVWGSNGQFQTGTGVGFYIDDQGYISHVKFLTNKDARGTTSDATTADAIPSFFQRNENQPPLPPGTNSSDASSPDASGEVGGNSSTTPNLPTPVVTPDEPEDLVMDDSASPNNSTSDNSTSDSPASDGTGMLRFAARVLAIGNILLIFIMS